MRGYEEGQERLWGWESRAEVHETKKEKEMTTKDLMLGNLITFKDSLETDSLPLSVEIVGLGYQGRGVVSEALVSINGDKICDIVEIDDECVGLPITPAILEKNGWYLANGVHVLKSVPRLGWNPKTKTLITGYYEFPVAIEYVHQLQQLMGLLGIENTIKI